MITQQGLEDDEPFAIIPLHFEFYYAHREQPMLVLTSFKVRAEALRSSTDSVKTLMGMIEGSILGWLDTRGEERMVFSDSRNNRRVILREGLQSISALAPDLETISTALEWTDFN